MEQNKATKSYREGLIDRLRVSEELQLEHLSSALEDDMPDVFLLALRDVVEARGLARFAEEADLNREHLYRILSKDGNPKLDSFFKILKALGFSLSLKKAA
ncbi:MAG: putative addiction module antidote protein [Bdellovibrionales bacterium]|nr:putative addiction module antidote protein [Bdellovibrionales bacterium]